MNTNAWFNKTRRFIPAFAIAALALLSFNPKSAHAQCYDETTGIDLCASEIFIEEMHGQMEGEMLQFISDEFQDMRTWMTDTFFKNQVLPAMMLMTEQMSVVGMHQAFIFGTFLDAKHQLETQRLLQELQYEAHRDYQPSDDFCWFGTNVRSLGATEELAKLNAASMNSLELKRQLGNANTAGAESRDNDKAHRWEQFRNVYCDKDDNNRIIGTAGTGLEPVCAGSAGPRVNSDIDYTRMVEEPRTIDVAFDDANMTDPEEDIMALANNLYGHDVLSRQADTEYLKNKQNQHLYLALRAVAAKRSVATNSFNSIVAMKASGTDDMTGASQTRDFLAAVMKELGIPDDEITPMIGEQPSYYAQLEILAKKIYQNPDFFASLYDSPANVDRKGVALKAIELMLDRAIYESQLRQEMATSVLLSTKVHAAARKAEGSLSGKTP